MSVAELLTLTHRFVDEFIVEADPDVVAEICTPDVSYRSPTCVCTGPAELRAHLQRVYKAFPDGRLDLVHTLASETHVGLRLLLHGTFRGEYMGIQPTQRRVALPAMALFGFAHTAIRDIELYYDVQILTSELLCEYPVTLR